MCIIQNVKPARREVEDMRMSQAEKDKSHARIVASASRLLRERGVGGASVSDVMKEAGLTHGGFYKHFANKDALAESALDSAFATFTATLDGDPSDAAAAFRVLYLSDGHVRNPGRGCPVPALGPDIGRGSKKLKAAFGRGVDRIVNALAESLHGSADARRAAAFQQFSMLVGAVVIARASDPQTADEVLSAVSAAVR
jgi:TetR/AcrR family transcriptional repressor of nem operon